VAAADAEERRFKGFKKTKVIAGENGKFREVV